MKIDRKTVSRHFGGEPVVTSLETAPRWPRVSISANPKGDINMQFIERYRMLLFNLEFRTMGERSRERALHNIAMLAMAMDEPSWAEWGI